MVRLDFRRRFWLMAVVFLVGFVALFAVGAWTLNTVRVGGPVYDEVVVGKDLIADILPPPRYIVEPYLLCYEIATTSDERDRDILIAELQDSIDAFEERGKVWDAKLVSPIVRKLLLEDSTEPAHAFFALTRERFLPAVRGDIQARPLDILTAELDPLFREHRRAVKRTVGAAEQRIREREEQAEQAVDRGRSWSLFVAGFVLLAFAGTLLWLSRSVLGRMQLVNDRMRALAEADANLTSRLVLRRDDEVGELAHWFDRFLDKIAALVAAVQRSSVQLASTATELAVTSREQEATVQRFGASTTQIAAATKEISATGAELVRTINEVDEIAGRSASVAADGRSGLEGMERSMARLADSSALISSKLSVINEKAGEIGVVVTTITKVADQTNLLSVNAAIEAEKAGEYGRGFLVVAREIRRLADQTATATLDIESTVGEMQSAVSAGVMEMDKFTDQMRRSVARVNEVGVQLGVIIEQVEGLSERFGTVREGMGSQAQGAEQINDAMETLSDSVRQTVESLGEFTSVADALKGAMEALKSELGKFRLEA